MFGGLIEQNGYLVFVQFRRYFTIAHLSFMKQYFVRRVTSIIIVDSTVKESLNISFVRSMVVAQEFGPLNSQLTRQ